MNILIIAIVSILTSILIDSEALSRKIKCKSDQFINMLKLSLNNIADFYSYTN
jgi:hypothetical protein